MKNITYKEKAKYYEDMYTACLKDLDHERLKVEYLLYVIKDLDNIVNQINNHLTN